MPRERVSSARALDHRTGFIVQETASLESIPLQISRRFFAPEACFGVSNNSNEGHES